MTRHPSANRTLFIHQAHNRIGVPGAAFHPNCPVNETDKEIIRVLLVSDPADREASTALDAFEPIVSRQRNLEHDRTDFNATFIGENINADCMVLFAQGLHVFGRGADFEPERIAEDLADCTDELAGEMKVVAAAPWHPVLDRVCTFNARLVSRRFSNVPDSAITLLLGKIGEEDGERHLLAWTDESPVRRFHTLLGSSEDFCCPDFVQLALNAIEWAGW